MFRRHSDTAADTTGHHLGTIVAKSAAVAGLAAATALLVAPMASAATPAAGHQVGDFTSEGVVLNDLTPFQLHEQSASAPGGWGDDGAPNQTQVSPGYASTWWVAFTPYSPFTVDYTFTDAQGNVQTVHATQADTQDATPTCSVTGTDSADWTCDVTQTSGENNFALNLHATTAAMDVSQSSKNQFAQALNDLCQSTSSAGGQITCSFTPDGQPPVYVESKTGAVPTGALDMAGCYPTGDPRDSYSYQASGSTSQTVSDSESNSLTVTAGVSGVASAAFAHSSTWGQAFTSGKAYADTIQVSAPWGWYRTPFWYPTIGSASGTFTATIGGTTYTFDKVTINTAGVAGGGLGVATPSYTGHQMTKAQFQQNCSGNQMPPWMH